MGTEEMKKSIKMIVTLVDETKERDDPDGIVMRDFILMDKSVQAVEEKLGRMIAKEYYGSSEE